LPFGTFIPLMSYTLKEYGSNIRKIADHILTVEDKETRTKQAHSLVYLMKQLHPSNPGAQEPDNKFWDDLYLMTNFKLDVEAPYPMPDPEILGKKPLKMLPNSHEIKFRHYGYNMELLIKKAVLITNPDEKEAATVHICKLMKSFYAAWNQDNIEDEVILEQLAIISNGQLSLNAEKVLEEKLLHTAKDYKRMQLTNDVDTKHDNRFNRNAGENNPRNNNNNRNFRSANSNSSAGGGPRNDNRRGPDNRPQQGNNNTNRPNKNNGGVFDRRRK